MTIIGWMQIALVLAALAACAYPLGSYIARILTGERVLLSAVLGPVERGFYALAGVDTRRGMGWKSYAVALLLLNALHFLLLYGILRLQWYLAFNPQALPSLPTARADNTAAS